MNLRQYLMRKGNTETSARQPRKRAETTKNNLVLVKLDTTLLYHTDHYFATNKPYCKSSQNFSLFPLNQYMIYMICATCK